MSTPHIYKYIYLNFMVRTISLLKQGKLGIFCLFMSFLVFSCQQESKSLKQTQKASLGIHSLNFLNKLDNAAASENSGDYILSKSARLKVKLNGGNLKALSKLFVTKNGKLIIVDSFDKRVLLYDQNGEYIQDIGSNGNGNGKYLFPSGVTENDLGEICVADFTNKRVLIYSEKGELRNTFTYTGENFSALGIYFNPINNSYLLTGNRWALSRNKTISGARMIHTYNKDGDILSSNLDFPEWAKPLDLYVYDTPLLDIYEGKVYAMLPFDYLVYATDQSNKCQEILNNACPEFKKPTTRLVVDKNKPEQALQAYDEWMLTWTSVRYLAVLNNNIIIQYQNFSPLRYHVDIWNIRSRKQVSSFSTNRALLSHDKQGNLFFLENIDERVDNISTLSKITLDDLLETIPKSQDPLKEIEK